MKRFGVIAGILLVFLISAFSLVVIYNKGKDQKPLRYADIPQETIDWINNIGDETNDIISSFNPTPRPTPWDNDDDIGQDPETGLKTLEDEYFIFYFPESLKKAAYQCQPMAHQAIPRIEEIVGKYYYPSDMNGRKVPIYLTNDQQSFEQLMSKMTSSSNDYENVAGITVWEVGLSGFYLKCIALNGKYCFRDKKYTKHVMWHELTHYCYYASIDYGQYNGRLPMWVTEGIAEYVGYPGERPSFSNDQIQEMRQGCDFSAPHFKYVHEVYQGGHSIYCFMEDRYRLPALKQFLKGTYSEPLATAVQQAFSVSVRQLENEWKANLDKFER